MEVSTKRYANALAKAEPSGEFSAIVSPFGGEPDVQGDVIDDHAYDRFISEWRATGANLPVVDGHVDFVSVGDLGYVKELEAVPAVGLYVVGQLDFDNPRARYAHKLMRERRRVEFSIGYSLYPGGQKTREDGARVLTAIRLNEISLVLAGAARSSDGRPRTELLGVKAASPPAAPKDPLIAEVHKLLDQHPEPASVQSLEERYTLAAEELAKAEAREHAEKARRERFTRLALEQTVVDGMQPPGPADIAAENAEERRRAEERLAASEKARADEARQLDAAERQREQDLLDRIDVYGGYNR